MAYAHTSISVEQESIDKAKQLQINVSKLVREKLKEAIETIDPSSLENMIKELKVSKIELEVTIEEIETKIKEIEADKQIKTNATISKYDNVTEVQDLTPEFLANSEHMMKLVDVIREKYPSLRASVKEIQDYYQLKEATKGGSNPS